MTWTRVKDKRTGAHISVPRVDQENHEVLEDHDALDRNGLPLGPKYPNEELAKSRKGRAAHNQEGGAA